MIETLLLWWMRGLPKREAFYQERHDSMRRQPTILMLMVKDDVIRLCPFGCGDLREMCRMTCKG